MARTNIKQYGTTHEGGRAIGRMTPIDELRRTVNCCLLWEDSFYESGVSIADRITGLVDRCNPTEVAQLAVEARKEMKLRHAPLLLAVALAKRGKLTKETLTEVLLRADEPGEFLSLYWKDGKQPLSAQIKKGLAEKMTQFGAYHYGKYDRASAAVKFRDIFRLVHPKPKNAEQELLFKQVMSNRIPAPDTWETALMQETDKLAAWTRLLDENKLGTLALIRNLRNMQDAGVRTAKIREALRASNPGLTLPFRFLMAGKVAPDFEPELEEAMFKAVEGMPKLKGKTNLLVDVSASMTWDNVSKRSKMTRLEAAIGLAVLARELCEEVDIFTFSNNVIKMPPRRGFALRDVIMTVPNSGTYLGRAVQQVDDGSRLIVLTDEQSADAVRPPKGNGYMLNVASYKPSVAFGNWNSITGWSERVLEFIREFES